MYPGDNARHKIPDCTDAIGGARGGAPALGRRAGAGFVPFSTEVTLSEEKPAPPPTLLDVLTKFVTFVSLAVALFAAWKALPADAEIKRLQVETQRLDLALKQADAELKNLESNRRVTLELYQEVKKVIEKKAQDPREEDALRVLVESLADDPFRWKLLRVLAVGAASPEVKETAAATSRFYEEEATSQTRLSAPAGATPSQGSAAFGAYNIDIFYCQTKQATSEPTARSVLQLRAQGDTGRWRVRSLPESINRQPGYGVATNEIRFTPPEERPVAEALSKALSARGVSTQFRETSYPTPGYVSVFICQ